MDENGAFIAGATGLTWPDYLLTLACVAGMCWVGLRMSRRSRNTEDFFLGGRRMPWWAAALAFVAAEISAMTIIGIPATAFRENWQYAQFFIGSAAARLTIAFLFIPAFYRYECTSIYEYLRHRFGPGTQVAACSFFFLTRLLASGVRLMAACTAVSVLLGLGFAPVLIFFSIVSVGYICIGGMSSVVWTGVFQAGVFILSGLATLAFILFSVDGGLPAVIKIAEAGGRLSLWNLGPKLGSAGFFHRFFSDPNIVWVAVLNGFFGSMAAFGTDQEMTQRLLAVETRRQSQRSMLHTIGLSFFVLALYLAIGTGLYAYYQVHPEQVLPAGLDKIYPHFAARAMPVLLRGLLLAAVILASIDSPLASLSSAFVTDIYRPLLRKGADEAHYLKVSRICIGCFGVLLAIIAYTFSSYDGMLWLAFKIGGVTYGSLLGVFLFGLLTRRGGDRGNVVAMVLAATVNLFLLILSERGILPLGWSWLVILGTFMTLSVSWLFSSAAVTPAEAGVRQQPSPGSRLPPG
ncbi:MAG: sodium/solute symporter [Elusimicrobiota bacterium]|jgi:SSS family transporter